MDTNNFDSVDNVLKNFASLVRAGIPPESAASAYLKDSTISTNIRILLATRVASQETPAAAALLLDLLCDNRQPAAMHDHCLKLLRGMKNEYEVLCEINTHYLKLQNQLNELNFGCQKGSLIEVNSNLCCMQKLMCDLNSVKLPLKNAETSKQQAKPSMVPVH